MAASFDRAATTRAVLELGRFRKSYLGHGESVGHPFRDSEFSVVDPGIGFYEQGHDSQRIASRIVSIENEYAAEVERSDSPRVRVFGFSLENISFENWSRDWSSSQEKFRQFRRAQRKQKFTVGAVGLMTAAAYGLPLVSLASPLPALAIVFLFVQDWPIAAFNFARVQMEPADKSVENLSRVLSERGESAWAFRSWNRRIAVGTAEALLVDDGARVATEKQLAFDLIPPLQKFGFGQRYADGSLRSLSVRADLLLFKAENRGRGSVVGTIRLSRSVGP